MKKNTPFTKIIFVFIVAIFSGIVFTTGCGPAENKNAACANDSANAPSGKFFTLSDIHFNPFYDPSLAPKLLRADVQQWESIFESSTIKNCGAYNYDSNYPLMKNAFGQMHTVNAHPDFIVLTGDFLSHQFQDSAKAFTKIQSADSIVVQDSINIFITKTIQFIALELGKTFPGVPFYPVLGNNDDFCGDYMIQPNDPFLPVFANAWASSLDSIKGENTFRQTVPTGGYYATSLPGFPDHVIIGMNSIFFCPKDTMTCWKQMGDTTSGHPEMTWIKQTLDRCRQEKKKVWFTCHIPLGADVHSSLKSQGDPTKCEAKIKMMWKSEYNSEFLALENEYKDVIMGGLAGHTHMDDFRVVSDPNGNAISFFHINPSISPIDGNNPGFQLFTYDPQEMKMLDFDSYVFQGLQSGAPSWMMEYDFGKTYKVNSLTAKDFQTAWNEINSDTIIRGNYVHYYSDGGVEAMPKIWKPYWCGIGHLDQTGFANCACGLMK